MNSIFFIISSKVIDTLKDLSSNKLNNLANHIDIATKKIQDIKQQLFADGYGYLGYVSSKVMEKAEQDLETFKAIFTPLQDEIVDNVKIIEQIGKSNAVVSKVEIPSIHNQGETIQVAMKEMKVKITQETSSEMKRVFREIGMMR